MCAAGCVSACLPVCACMSMPVACVYKCVCLPGTAPVWGGRASSKELSSASVPQDTLQLSPRGHEKQSEPRPSPLVLPLPLITELGGGGGGTEKDCLHWATASMSQPKRGAGGRRSRPQPRCFHTVAIQCAEKTAALHREKHSGAPYRQGKPILCA